VTDHDRLLVDQGKRNTIESSHAKRFAADAAMEVATDAVQVYGGSSPARRCYPATSIRLRPSPRERLPGLGLRRPE
jgi:alkylation response protein AidB-like acyl-CoA dehydrogenase